MTVASATMPAPTMGIDAISPAGAIQPDRCVYAWNVVTDELGLRARSGYALWASGLLGGTAGEVRTMCPFFGSAAASAGDRLFAMTARGVYDVTSPGAAPPVVLGFALESGESGFGTCRGFVTAAGHFLAYCDEANGYHLYSESTGLFREVEAGPGATQISGVDPRRLAYVMSHKGRLWFAERHTSDLWYLPAGAIYGTAQRFAVGSLLPHGGHVVGAWTWSYDGGSGPDDLFVIAGSGGDILVYQGTDPASAETWAIKGSWYVGGFPSGRRIALDSGGELLVMTLIGLLPLSRLVLGSDPQDRRIYVTRWIDPVYGSLVAQRGRLPGWGLYMHPVDRVLLVSIPSVDGAPNEQIAISTITGAATRWRGLPLLSGAVLDGLLFAGSGDGRIYRCGGWVDALDPVNPAVFTPVKASILTAYQTMGAQAWKQVQTVRPVIIGGAPRIPVMARARYGYMIDEPLPPEGGGGGAPGTWDYARWDDFTWGPDYLTTAPVVGGAGMGREVAIAVRWNAISRSTLVEIGVTFTTGGPM